MIRSRLFGFLGLTLIFHAVAARASDRIAIDESQIRIEIGNTATLKLPVTNTTGRPISSSIHLAFLDPHDSVRHQLIVPVTVETGSQSVAIPVPGLLKIEDAVQPNYNWLRLRYEIPGEAEGVVSVLRIAHEPFVMSVVRPGNYTTPTRYRVQVLTQDPALGKPVPNVEISGRLAFEDDGARPTQRTARTNSGGFAELIFDLPKNIREQDLELQLTGRLGNFARKVSETFSLRNRFAVITSTDKPIYQPGQKLRVRTLAFDRGRAAAKGVPLSVSIWDSAHDKVFEVSLMTSAYGEAHTEWEIQDNAKLGAYQIRVELPDGSGSYDSVLVSRYDLPNFTVDVKHDRPYYLPGQNPEVDVQTDYLFGKHVPLAKVKVVQEVDRIWNYRELKWDVEEGQVVEGAANKEGRFHATLDVAAEFSSLSEESGRGYRDLDYRVSATDPSTNRTEQRRFRLRVTRHAIHLYIAQPSQVRGLPMELHLAASYADGSPAICNVEILGMEGERRVSLATVKTNKYGVAKVSGLPTSADFWQDVRPQLEFRASDSSGKTGIDQGYLDFDSYGLLVHTDKVLYRALEPVHVSVDSPTQTGPVLISASRNGQVLYSSVLQLSRGKGTARIPASKGFEGVISIAAYSPSGEQFGARHVSFPEATGLQIESVVDKSTHEPGEEARLTFRVRNADGSPVESLIGITVLDKAVEERARTDAEFGGNYSICPRCQTFLGFVPEIPGLSRKDLDRIDRNNPPSDLALAVEVLLAANSDGFKPETFGDSTPVRSAFYTNNLENRFRRLRQNGAAYPSGVYLPSDEASLREMVLRFDPDFDTLRDPWNNLYRLSSSVLWRENLINVLSAGPDERFDTPDDFQVAWIRWPYFGEYGRTLNLALSAFHQRTGSYVKDIQTLRSELQRLGENFDAWRDPRGGQFTATFDIDRTEFRVVIHNSEGSIWTGGTDYTSELQVRVSNALSQFVEQQDALPANDDELKTIFQKAGIRGPDLMDPWGRPLYSVLKTEFGYGDRVTFVSGVAETTRIVPVSRESRVIRLRSAGPDRLEGTPDDFTVVTFLKPVREQSVENAKPQFVESPLADLTHGAVFGAVIDLSGALIPGVRVEVIAPTGESFDLLTAELGNFVLRNLEPGTYRVRFSLPGFKTKVVTGVVVRLGIATSIIATLEVASVSSSVDVSVAAELPLVSSSASVGEVRSTPGAGVGPAAISTPRLREFFPETLLWQPAVETGPDGNAQVRFKLADNITTWKATAIVSTKDGRLAVAEKEIVAFQPFFLEHEPPKFLTEGDRIDLPVVVRSYLDRDQTVDLSMKPEGWFALVDAPSRKTEIKSGESSREVFTFKATAPVIDGRQRITAQGLQASDAIEKTSTVFPFGREITHVESGILRNMSVFDVVVPSEALKGTTRGELKIYPNLMSHVADSIENIMRRPYGCAEQVISAAYPSLLYLRYNKQIGNKSDPQLKKAARYVQLALQKLSAYQEEDGGYSYWGKGNADPAVTAYAVQFLNDASEFVSVDEDRLSQAGGWLAQQQGIDGGWRGETALTALIARILSTPGLKLKNRDRLPSLLSYLQKHPQTSSSPYATASLALAAFNVGDRRLAESALATLRAGAQRENGTAFWDLQTNTPFYGWGLPGRLETTAIVLRALAAGGTDVTLVDEGLLFLLRNKDQYGIWYSSQATVQVLETLVSLAGSRQIDGSGSADVLVNGVRVATIDFGGREKSNSPVTFDVSRFLSKGANHIELMERKKTSTASVQLIESHYVPWDASVFDSKSAPLRFSVRYDKDAASINDVVSVHVEVERFGLRGYGMMLAEIGLPPGAEVDRNSLADAVARSGWVLSRYDVLPDRVIAYVWPAAGGTSFDFKFRPRYGLDAHTTASKLYDYYNPEAFSILAPVRFAVK